MIKVVNEDNNNDSKLIRVIREDNEDVSANDDMFEYLMENEIYGPFDENTPGAPNISFEDIVPIIGNLLDLSRDIKEYGNIDKLSKQIGCKIVELYGYMLPVTTTTKIMKRYADLQFSDDAKRFNKLFFDNCDQLSEKQVIPFIRMVEDGQWSNTVSCKMMIKYPDIFHLSSDDIKTLKWNISIGNKMYDEDFEYFLEKDKKLQSMLNTDINTIDEGSNNVLIISDKFNLEKFEYSSNEYFAKYKSVKVSSKCTKYMIEDGVLLSSDKKILYGIVSNRDREKYTIPHGITSINEYAFAHCESLTSVNIPDGVTSIGNSAFYFCDSLTSVRIPDSITSIGSKAFFACKSLTSIIIPDSVTSIGSEAFSACKSLTSVTISNSLTIIKYHTFYGCVSLTNITIPNSVERIGSSAFSGCTSLKSIEIPEGVTSIDMFTFDRCTDLTVTIPDSVTSIDYGAFRHCNNIVIKCYKGSYADEFARENNISVKYI